MAKLSQRDQHWVPAFGAALTALVGAVNIASALTPDIAWRGHLLLHVEAVHTLRFFHALALPAGALLLLVAPYLLKRRRRALDAALLLMLVLGVVNLLKGLDYEETTITWLAGAGLMAFRGAFEVDHDPITLRSAVWRVPLLGIGGLALATLAAWASEGHPSVSSVTRETWDVLIFKARRGPLRFENHTAGLLHHYVQFQWIPLAIHFVEIGTLLLMAYVVFRPLSRPHALPSAGVRRLAAGIVREHGRDTLSFFKLREDKHLFFNEDRSAFVGYRIDAGVLLLSGDPVGPAEAFPDLVRGVHAFARARGLKFGALSVSEPLRPLYETLGLRSLYMGDEAVLDLGSFSLQGRPIRKVRQSVTRLTKAGYAAELRSIAEFDAETLHQVERVLEIGRMGAPEKGFSMGMDSIRGEGEQDTLFMLARDESDPARPVRGVLHFVPCYGRPAVSLSLMRRDPATPNGLTEFLVAEAARLLHERGLEEMSLNFATAARYLHDPHGLAEHALGKLASVLNPYFQIESLYKFNAKFFPRWEPRYLVYEGRFGFPRAFLAAMWLEGQIGKPSLPDRLRLPLGRAGAERRGARPVAG